MSTKSLGCCCCPVLFFKIQPRPRSSRFYLSCWPCFRQRKTTIHHCVIFHKIEVGKTAVLMILPMRAALMIVWRQEKPWKYRCIRIQMLVQKAIDLMVLQPPSQQTFELVFVCYATGGPIWASKVHLKDKFLEFVEHPNVMFFVWKIRNFWNHSVIII